MKIYPNAMCVTPFADDGSLHLEAVAHLIDRIAACGLGVFVGGSSPGQGYTLSFDETEQLLGAARDAADGRVRVMASGFEPRTPQMLIELSSVVRSAGVDGMQVYSLDIGHGGLPSSEEIYEYETTVLRNIATNAVISTHENMRYLIPHDVLERLVVENDNVVGLNINTNNMRYLRGAIEIARRCDRDVEVHVGSTEGSLGALALGANGFLTAEANIAPEICAEVTTGWMENDLAKVMNAYRRMTAISPIMEFGTAVKGIKAAMQMLHLPGTYHRAPLLGLTPDQTMQVADYLRTAELVPDLAA